MSNYGNPPEDPQGQNPPPSGDQPGDQPPPPPPGQDPYGQQPPPPPGYGQPSYGQPDYGAAGGAAGGGAAGGYGGQPPYGQQPQGAPTSGFSVSEALSYGGRKLQANFGPILVAAIILFVGVAVVQILSTIISNSISSPDPLVYNPNTGEFEGGASNAGFFGASLFVSLIFGALSFVVQTLVGAGIVKGALDITHGRQVSLGSMFSGLNYAQILIAAVILAVATTIGLLLCILPGIAIMFLTVFTTYFIIDKDMPAIDAIKASVSLVSSNIGALILFFLACIALYIVGAILCLIGLLVAIPVVYISSAYAFRTLQGETVAP